MDGIAFSAVRLHHVVATIRGYSDMCEHRGKSVPQQRSRIWGLCAVLKSAQLTSGQVLLFGASSAHLYDERELIGDQYT